MPERHLSEGSPQQQGPGYRAGGSRELPGPQVVLVPWGSSLVQWDTWAWFGGRCAAARRGASLSAGGLPAGDGVGVLA